MPDRAPYDSSADTLRHIRRVSGLLGLCAADLVRRGAVHDDSKLAAPEKEAFDVATPKLKSLTFGSEDYKRSLADLGPALAHHYAANDHHPEHFPDGVGGMDLIQMLEMACDWKAAAERGRDGTVNMAATAERFGLDERLAGIIGRTIDRLTAMETSHG